MTSRFVSKRREIESLEAFETCVQRAFPKKSNAFLYHYHRYDRAKRNLAFYQLKK
jgi:predicted RecB family nuclease